MCACVRARARACVRVGQLYTARKMSVRDSMFLCDVGIKVMTVLETSLSEYPAPGGQRGIQDKQTH